MTSHSTRVAAVGVAAVLAAATLVVTTSASAALPARPGCTAASQSRLGRIGGVVAPGTDRRVAAPSCEATVWEDHNGTPPQDPYSGDPPILFNGGPVMDATSAVTITPIYWAPVGYTYPSTYQSLTERFVTDLAHDSGDDTNVFATWKQYTDGSDNHITYTVTAGTPIDVTTAYPTSGGCTPDTGEAYSDGAGYSACLTDAQIQTEIAAVLNAHSLPSDLSHLYLVYLPKGVESCFTTQNNASGGQCTISAQGGAFCGYHSYFGSTTIYADLPYAIEDNPVNGATCASDGGRLEGGSGFGNQSPNGDLDADTVISVTSHEISESVTDPTLDAWYDGAGNEMADDCAYIYGDTSTWGGSAGAYYNQTINGHHYFIQEEFSNQEYAADSSFSCIEESLPQTVSFTSTAPTDAKVTNTYQVTATATSGLAVTLSVDASSASVCAIDGSSSGSTVTFNATGTCVLDADQFGDTTHVPATQVKQTVVVNPGVADGAGTLTVLPATARYGSAGNTLAFTYTAAAGGVADGEVDITVPAGWSAPSTAASAEGDTTSTCGTVAVVGAVIELTGVTRSAGTTCTTDYGSKAGSGPGATAPTDTGIDTFSTSERSTAGGTLLAIGASPTVTVGKASSTTTLLASARSVTYGDEKAVLFRGRVVPGSTGATATGTITVTASTTRLCVITLVAGSGTCRTSSERLDTGSHSVIGTFSGNASVAGSGSTVTSLAVTRASTKTTLTASATKVTYGHEQSERLSVVVAPRYPGSQPTGKVTIKHGSATVCTISLSAGRGSCTLASKALAVGTNYVVASFDGDTRFTASSSARAKVIVAK